jgi:hypothetical protein
VPEPAVGDVLLEQEITEPAQMDCVLPSEYCNVPGVASAFTVTVTKPDSTVPQSFETTHLNCLPFIFELTALTVIVAVLKLVYAPPSIAEVTSEYVPESNLCHL